MPTISFQSNHVLQTLERNAQRADRRDNECFARNPDMSVPTNGWWSSQVAPVNGGETMDTEDRNGGSGEWGFLNPEPEERERLARDVWPRDKPLTNLWFNDQATNEPVHWPRPAAAYYGPAYECVDRHYAKPDPNRWLAVEVKALQFDRNGQHTVDLKSVRPATREELQQFASEGRAAEEDPLLYAACHSDKGCHDLASVTGSLRQHLKQAHTVLVTPGLRREVSQAGEPPVEPYEPRLGAALDRKDVTLFVLSRREAEYGVPPWAQRDRIAADAGGTDRQCLPTPVTGSGLIVAGPRAGQVISEDSTYYCPLSGTYTDELK